MKTISLLPEQLDAVLDAAKRFGGRAPLVLTWGTDHRGPLLLARVHTLQDQVREPHVATVECTCEVTCWEYADTRVAWEPYPGEGEPRRGALWHLADVKPTRQFATTGRRFMYETPGMATATVVAVHPDGSADVRLDPASLPASGPPAAPIPAAGRTGLPDVGQVKRRAPKRPAADTGPSLF